MRQEGVDHGGGHHTRDGDCIEDHLCRPFLCISPLSAEGRVGDAFMFVLKCTALCLVPTTAIVEVLTSSAAMP
jgi:hypothetical protein